jgi:hypothetical protein
VRVEFVGDAKLGFEEVASFLKGPCMDQANVFVDATAAAKHAGHPRDYSVVATGCVKVLFDVGFARGAGDLVLHLFDEHREDEGLSAGEAAVLARVQGIVVKRVVDDVAPLHTE